MDRAQRQRLIQRVMQEGEVGTQREFSSAAAVSRQIDTLSHADVPGTIAGDDTLLMAVEPVTRAPSLKRYLGRLREGSSARPASAIMIMTVSLPQSFFARSALDVARDLVGCTFLFQGRRPHRRDGGVSPA